MNQLSTFKRSICRNSLSGPSNDNTILGKFLKANKMADNHKLYIKNKNEDKDSIGPVV